MKLTRTYKPYQKLKELFNKFLPMVAYAEELETKEEEPKTKEPEKVDPQNGTKEQLSNSQIVNYGIEHLVEKARADEKAKLYPQIEKLKKEKNEAISLVSERDKKIKELENQVAELQKSNDGKVDNKQVTELNVTISALENQLAELQAKYDNDVQSLTVKNIAEREIAKANGQIIPELVTGNTEEEILANVELAKQRYQEIQASALRGVQLPKANPSTNVIMDFKDKTVEEIARMTPQEYAKYRAELNIQ